MTLAVVVVGLVAQLLGLVVLAVRAGERLGRIDEKLVAIAARLDRLEPDAREARDAARAAHVRLDLVHGRDGE